jgi:signal transduction histidine kinase
VTHGLAVSLGPADTQRSERVLAAARVFFAAASLVAVGLDPTQPIRFAATAYALLAGYLLFALAIWLRVRADRYVPGRRAQLAAFVGDLAWATLVTAITEGPNSPFFIFFMFVLLSAAYRWGFAETLCTALLSVTLLAVEAAMMQVASASEILLGDFDVNRLIMRSAYLLIGGVLLGYLADEEKLRRGETVLASRIVAKVRADTPIWNIFESVGADILHLSSGRSVLLIFTETQTGRTFLWTAQRAAGDTLRIQSSAISPEEMRGYEVATPGHAWYATSSGSIALDAEGRRIPAGPFAAPPHWIPDRSTDRMIGLTVAFADMGSGHVLIFDPAPCSTAALRFLQRLANQVAPAMYSVYLLRRLGSRVGALERGRIARELHDGVVQSLIALQMQLDTLRTRSTDAAGFAEELAQLQATVAAEVMSLRELMHQLEPLDFPPHRLLEHLQGLVSRFQRETGIHARFASDVEDVALSPAVCHEVARIVQEALVNVRKHSGASHVAVRFTTKEGASQVIIDNDGRAFDFAGRMSLDQLDHTRKGPVVIKQRVRAIGADLTIDSSPTWGVRLEITLPPRIVIRRLSA